ncbi:hypothetical protein JFT44_11515 [Pseudomonas sp. MF5691]|uniref:LysR substrate-binding domain-containing protein n=1 Tax=Pseudomonas sp. MF5691 TaxID=2797526 RepID=UPI0018E7C88E|nr:LysR substrate-binding domain-containing protein [Pseudomonas sp. MF5691]MBJ2290561.1 hypothetical protein [Pseudomonas sp. MF5691]
MKSGVVVSEAGALIQCGLAGIGILQGPRSVLQPHIDSGALVEVLQDFKSEPKLISILFPDRRNLSPNVRVFVEWAAEIFRSIGCDKKSR